MTDRTKGLGLALAAAGISGVAVFVNGYGVKAAPDATVYTTAKNLVAAAFLVLIAAAIWQRPAHRPVGRRPKRPVHWVALGVIGIVGGSVPFVLFFEGLARTSSTQAAFLQKTLVVWVALLAIPVLAERIRLPHLAAIALLMVGQVLLVGRLPVPDGTLGEALVLAATLLWAVEVVVAKRVLRDIAPATVAVSRMVLGSVVLVGWLAVTGRLDTLTGLSANGWLWAVLTGAILAGYVATWFTALALAPAVDVTAVLVVAAVITALLNAAVKGATITATAGAGLVLVALGAALAMRRPPAVVAA
jgi:drug/metabolite transporter (DMT)-like permease